MQAGPSRPERHFADRLMQAIEEKNSRVVVGIDPRLAQLPPDLALGCAVQEAGENNDEAGEAGRVAEAFWAFGRAIIDAVADVAVAVKPQVAFYERYGWPGLRAYARTLAYARSKGLLAIADVKRGDIGSTAEAYAAAYFGDGTLPAGFIADAVTVNPFLGSDGILPFLEAASRAGGGVFVLVKTSNPSSGELQDLPAGTGPVQPPPPLYERLARQVETWAAASAGASGYGLAGAVVGATYAAQLEQLRRLMPHVPLLVPGYGAQGAGPDEVRGAFDGRGLGAVVNSAREIIFAWQKEPWRSRYGPERFDQAARQAALAMRDALNDALERGG